VDSDVKISHLFKRLATGKHATDDIKHVQFGQVVHQQYFGLFHRSKEDFKSKVNFNPLDTKLMADIDVILFP